MSFSSSLARGVTKAIIAERNRKKREQQRVMRERQRAINKVNRERIRAAEIVEKERYKERRKQEAEQKTKKLLTSYKEYSELFVTALKNTDVFNFADLKKAFVPINFCYSEQIPQKCKPILRKVTRESWLDNISPFRKKKRLSIIKRNEELNIQAEEDYRLSIGLYNKNKNAAYHKWYSAEKTRKEEISIHNGDIDQWKNKYMEGEEEAVERFAHTLLDSKDYSKKTVIVHSLSFNKDKMLVVEFVIEDRDKLFPIGGYRYMIQSDEFRPQKIKVSDLNDYMKELLCEIVNTIVAIIFKNDIANSISNVVVNGFHRNICCVTCKVKQGEFFEYDFSEIEALFAKDVFNVKVYSQISKGVKPLARFMQ